MRRTVTSLHDEYDRFIRPIELQMMRSVWRITHNADDADDAFQEAIAQIWKSRQRIWQHANPRAVILRICTQAACDILRRKMRHLHPEQTFDVAVVATPEADVAKLVLMDEQREAIKAAIARLSERQAVAVTMRYLMDCTFEEIAQGMDCAEATARVHVSRGLGCLRRLLADMNPSSKQDRK